MMEFFYAMSAKGIQEFILRGNKLRLLLGGSELIEALPLGFLKNVLNAMGLVRGKDYEVLMQAAGSARILMNQRQDAERLALMMPLLVSRYAPGLEIVQDVRPVGSSLAGCLRDAENAMGIRRNILYPDLPVPGPLVKRAPRSGLAAVSNIRWGTDVEPADAAMLAKEGAAGSGQRDLATKLLPSDPPGLTFVEQIDELGLNETDYMAVFHADGNGMGKIVLEFLTSLEGGEITEAAGAYSRFCQEVSKASVDAVRTAISKIPVISNGGSLKRIPAMPIICAGDDITFLLRASDALTFAETVLGEFRSKMASGLQSAQLPFFSGKSFSACAGIAFVKPNYPFSSAYALSESLCRYAKKATSRRHSAIAFHRITSHAASKYETILKSELTSGLNCLTMMPYLEGPNGGGHHPKLNDLKELVVALKSMPRGSFRRLLNELYRDRSAAESAFERIIEVAERSKHGSFAAIAQVKDVLSRITGSPGASQGCLFRATAGGGFTTPIRDAIELAAAGIELA